MTIRQVGPFKVNCRPGTTDDYVCGEVFDEDTYRLRRWAHYFPGRPVLDLGANCGIFTLLACDLGASQVYAVEPAPENLRALGDTVTRNRLNEFVDRVEILPNACVGSGTQSMRVVRGDDPLCTGGFQTEAIDGPLVIGADRDVVPTIHVNNLLSLHDSWACVKIDTEGAEYDIVPGIDMDLLRRVDILVMEFHTPTGRGTLGSLLDKLADWGAWETMGYSSRGGQLYGLRYGA